MPRGFRFPIQNPLPSLWISVANDTEGEHAVAKQRGFDALDVIGRLKPGVSPQQALTEVSLIARRIAENDPEADKAYNTALVEPLLGHYVDDSKPALRVLFAAVGLLLLIACANVAGLLLARATRQRSEIAVRLALGASRGRIVRQILAESVLLSTIAGAIGVVLAGGILRALLQFVPKSVPRIEQAAVDPVVLAFATLVSLATGVLFGVLPALRMSRLDPITAIREGGRGAAGARGQNRLHAILVIAEVAVGLVLLVGSGLLIRSFVAVSRTNPGFDAHNVLTASVTLPGDRYDRTHRIQFFQTLIDRLRALPGVRAVTAGFPLPLSEGRIGVSFEIEGHGESEGQSGENLGVMLPGYFVAMRIPVLQGREFTDRDTTTSPPVILIDERFAHKYFPGENPVGKHMQSKLGDGVLDKPMREIVGVVGNIKAEGLTVEPRPHYYLPFEQAVITSPPISIRTAVDPLSLVAPLRAEVARLDPQLPLYRVRTLEDLRYRAAAEPRFQTLLLSSFAAMALLLAAVGLYGVLSYMVTQRVPEIGLRIALGARRSDVMALVLRRGMGLATVGAAVGMLASLFVTGFLEKLLYGVTPLDQLTFATVTVVLLLVALVAGAAPAMRASRVDPMNALRDQ
jgi:predicted permease